MSFITGAARSRLAFAAGALAAEDAALEERSMTTLFRALYRNCGVALDFGLRMRQHTTADDHPSSTPQRTDVSVFLYPLARRIAVTHPDADDTSRAVGEVIELTGGLMQPLCTYPEGDGVVVTFATDPIALTYLAELDRPFPFITHDPQAARSRMNPGTVVPC